MISISSKDLRQKLPQVIQLVKSGNVILLIHNSKPIAEIIPQTQFHSLETAHEDDIEQAALIDIQEECSPEEKAYYLSLGKS